MYAWRSRIAVTCLTIMSEKQKKNPNWIEVISAYNHPDVKKSIWQIINSLVPYMLLWVAMYYSLSVSYLLTLGLAVPAAGFLVRIFIIFHDCGHGSFFRKKKSNRIVGTILGSLSFTPYDRWHKDHAIHHKTVGNLDKRGQGDVWTLTVEEYAKLSPGKKRIYRIYRNPVVLFGLGAFLLFVIWFRFPRKGMEKIERRSVHITNLIILLISAGLILLMGWKAFLLIQLPVIYLATTAGVWLFYVQHQFEDVIWTRQEGWDYRKMAMEGSSFLRFPRLLQWFSGNIGYHHIHHLSPKIPNYKLERCHKENRMFSDIKAVTFVPSMRTMSLRLWNEKAGRLISFRQFKKLLPLSILLLLLSSFHLNTGHKQTTDTENWIPLFNGKDLAGWTIKMANHPMGENYKATFRVEDGLLKVRYDQYENFDGEFGHIFYKNPFAHYKLRLEYRVVGEQVNGGAGWALKNNGVMFHAQSPESMSLSQDFPVSLEAQLLGGLDDGPRPTGNLCTPGTNVVIDGELITAHCINSSSDTYNGEQWVLFELIVYGDSLIHHLVNGDTVLTYSKPQIGGSNLPENFPYPEGTNLGSGYIALQAESHPFDFRKVELLDLSK